MTEMREEALDPTFDVADRMRKALRESGVGVIEMADYLEVSRNTVSTWINGRIHPSAQTLRLFAMRTGVRYQWLKDGERMTARPPHAPSELPWLDSDQQPFDYRADGRLVRLQDWRERRSLVRAS